VVSAGGAITIDKVTSADIELRSDGGAITAGVLQGNLVVDSGAGELTLRRAVVPTAHIWTTTGAVDIAALYADSYAIETAGGTVQLGSSHASASAAVATGGGAVEIAGHEGEAPLRVDSGGGAINLKLLKMEGDIVLRSGGGKVTIKSGNKLAMSLEISAAAIRVDSQHSTNQLVTSTAEGTTGDARVQLSGVLNQAETMEDWLDVKHDPFQIDMSKRKVCDSGGQTNRPKPSQGASRLTTQRRQLPRGYGEDGPPKPLSLRIDAGGGEVEFLVGGWLDDILTGASKSG
jgi:DUF4097 and DUF4098 domain-containing protein YvlB